jgi:hypothetical protein
MPFNDVSKYRLRALECRTKAEIARDLRDKSSWHELERIWLDLAVRVEAEQKPRRGPAPLKSH